MIRQGLSTSILGRAEKRGFILFDIWNIRDYATEWYGHMGGAPYGGGAGMLMQADLILCCYCSTTADLPKVPRAIHVTPQGRQFTQANTKMLAAEETLLILYGHHEGVNERTLELLDAEPYSTGDYVLIGGEPPAMIMVDAISRIVPSVFSNQESDEVEPSEGNLPECPQYICPEVYEGLCVPPTLLSGDHKKVAQWRREQALP